MIAHWPFIAGAFFWFGALDQVRTILVRQSAEDVSFLAWAGSCAGLLGYVAFYRRLPPCRERTFAIVASWISASLYASISILVVIYG